MHRKYISRSSVLLAAGIVSGCDSATRPPDTPPLVRLEVPAADTTVLSAVVTLRGEASDDEEVRRVVYQVNGGTEQDLGITPGAEVQFTAEITLPGTENALVVTAVDDTGNASTVSVHVTRGGLALSSLSAGTRQYACGLAEDGTAHCWGVGYGSAPRPLFGGELSFHSLEAKSAQLGGLACGMTPGGEAYCWRSPRTAGGGPVELTRIAGDVSRVYPGYAIHPEGRVHFFGWNFFSPLPSITFPSPADTLQGVRLRSLSGGSHGCGLTEAGRAFCWGYGHSSTFERPVAVSGDLTFAQIDVGAGFTCGLTPEGAAYCWGTNASGVLGTASGIARSEAPVAVAGGHRFAAITAGGSHACGVTAYGRALCWGGNIAGQLGTGEAGSEASRSTPTPVVGERRFTEIAAGADFTCGLTRSGATYCWGSNSVGQLGRPPAGPDDRSPLPVPITGSRID